MSPVRKPMILVGVALAAVMAVVLLGAASTPALAQDSGATFTVGETAIESQYPRGMTFTVEASSDAGDITRAVLFIEMRPGTRERANADLNLEDGTWVAALWDTGGQPPWIDFDYTWLLTDSAGNTFETEPAYAIYEDHTREWFHVDTDDITLHWFGFPEEFGEMMAESMAVMREQFDEGWGRYLTYKPIAIFFPSGNVWDEFQAGGSNPGAAGFTNNGWGYSVQRFASETPPDFLMECVQRWGYPTERPMEWRMQRGVTTIVHEVTHMHQSDFRLSAPNWWREGQADYFAGLTGLDSDPTNRLTNLLSVTNDLPTLQGQGPDLALSVMAADSCNGLGYDIGNHFIGWLMANYGGLETHLAIVEAMPGNGLQNALLEVTGKTLLELENEWRATWGLAPVALLPTPTPFALPTAAPMVFPTAPPTATPNSSGG